MKVVLLGVDDWEALYIDRKKHEENHSLNLNYTLKEIIDKFNESGDEALSYETLLL